MFLDIFLFVIVFFWDCKPEVNKSWIKSCRSFPYKLRETWLTSLNIVYTESIKPDWQECDYVAANESTSFQKNQPCVCSLKECTTVMEEKGGDNNQFQGGKKRRNTLELLRILSGMFCRTSNQIWSEYLWKYFTLKEDRPHATSTPEGKGHSFNIMLMPSVI